ncbi:molybdopterin-guanine dinucleotide biosynthesis protein MobA [Halalkalibacter wakoensis JCM 9140]|uniref:Probable molybdenum cofactor guanylyltransferase n=1 Tax=Halalkalibacter wakoensis JCM 9140 TaxID=1236970 RepID=W4Q1U1_9BACI|nr:molybdenum cofactor guanylyltransferase [Halalkalibacter wakoensis]GAE25708.1 molybdopterin-guanine dinucleotide biosynthesis protein MobA [Halalkalibacter wakoensis JCM 9140]
MNIAGVVLAGGQSSRYGQPKMFEQHKGKAFYEHSVHALRASGVDSCYIVTNQLLADRFDRKMATVLIENQPHNGPLYALTFAMESIPNVDWYIVLAADLPFIEKAIIDQLTDEITKSSGHAAIIPITGEKEQPLLACYHRDCLPVARKLIANQRKSMRPLLQKVHTQYVHFPSNQKEFTNINYKSDWNHKTAQKERR